MNCPNCGKEIPEGSNFCPDCQGAIKGAVQAPAKHKTSGLAITSLVLGILGIFYGITAIPGLILGIIAYRDIKRRPKEISGKGLALAGIITSAITFILSIGVIVAIMIPSFFRFQAKALQSEARVNLRIIYNLQMEFYNQNNRYARSFEELDWSPVGKTRYAYFLTKESSIQPEDRLYELPRGVEAYVDEYGFQIIAVGNIDSDKSLDVWMIDTNGSPIILMDDMRD